LSQLSLNLYTNAQSYTVYGLYALDGTLLAAMLANAITFIVILIQYSLGDVCTTTTGQM
ncbi:maker70, partial [Drosophila busckii]